MEIRKGIIKAEDAGNHELDVQIVGSAFEWLFNVPAAKDIDFANCAPGDNCAVLFLDPNNPDDAVVIATW